MTDAPAANLPKKLPPLRQGITVAFDDYDAEGKPQWLIHDAGRNKFFIIGWLEYEIVSRWDLTDPEAIIAAINEETTLHVEPSDIEHFLKFLADHYLIKQSGYQIHKTANEQLLFKNDNLFHWLMTYYLFFKVPLCHPDRFLTRTRAFGRLLFHRTTAYIMIALAIVALYQVGARWEIFTHTFSSIFTLKGLFFSFIAFSFCKLFHELGHAYMCKRYGVPVPTLGIAFLVFWPVLYTDTTLSWTLSYDKRMRIALAGMWVETYITIIAALIWCNTTNLTIQAICYVTITVNWLASLFINVSPFMRFDGYYVLADYLKMPNLQPRAFALTRWALRRWCFGWNEPPPEKFKPRRFYFLIAYSIATWLYRLFLYLGIAILVYHFFIKLVGIILFAVEIYYFILNPIITELRFWIFNKDKFTLNMRTKVTLVTLIVIALLFFIPINQSIEIPATLSYAHQYVSAPEPGILNTPLPAQGKLMKKDQVIAVIRSPELEESMHALSLEYGKTLTQLRRSAINPDYSMQKSILLSDINKQRAEYQKLVELRNKLTLKAPFDGELVEVAYDIRPGTVLMKGQWLADLVDTQHVQIEAFVSQIDLSRVKPGITGYFYPQATGGHPVRVKVENVEALNSRELNCHFSSDVLTEKEESGIETPCYHASDLGGEVPTVADNDGKYIPVNSVYRVNLVTDSKVKLSFVERGSVVLSTSPNSYAHRLFYRLKTLWIEQANL